MIKVLLLVLFSFFITGCNSENSEKADFGNGIRVTKKAFDAPVNEQPFYGFIEKSAQLEKADKRFLDAVDSSEHSRKQWFDDAIFKGWEAIEKQDYGLAARRFNQAHLISPAHASVFHGFAVIVHERFKDAAFAEELFQAGSKQAEKPHNYMADYGRLLLIINKPKEALPILEIGVEHSPLNPNAWSNLAIARLYAGRSEAACEAIEEAEKLSPPPYVHSDILWLRRNANCEN